MNEGTDIEGGNRRKWSNRADELHSNRIIGWEWDDCVTFLASYSLRCKQRIQCSGMMWAVFMSFSNLTICIYLLAFCSYIYIYIYNGFINKCFDKNGDTEVIFVAS